MGKQQILLLVAFAAISCAGIEVCRRTYYCIVPGVPHLLLMAIGEGLLWMPIAFAGYMIGRKTITIKILIVFAICLAVAYASTYLTIWLAEHRLL
jgi:hypothetical protein